MEFFYTDLLITELGDDAASMLDPGDFGEKIRFLNRKSILRGNICLKFSKF